MKTQNKNLRVYDKIDKLTELYNNEKIDKLNRFYDVEFLE